MQPTHQLIWPNLGNLTINVRYPRDNLQFSSIMSTTQIKSNDGLEEDFKSEGKTTLLRNLVSSYKINSTFECKSIDSFLAFTILTGVAQLIYCFLTSAYPYNTFIGVFSSSVGSFVFAGKDENHFSLKVKLTIQLLL